MFSVESGFSLLSDSRWTFFYGECQVSVTTKTKSLNGTVMVVQWCSFGRNYSGLQNKMHVHIRTITEKYILKQHVYLFKGAMRGEILFMDDNACSHRTHIVNEYIKSEDVPRMDWPAFTCDFNLIEYAWYMLG
ncbi:UNVERIFIED_CONTAM: hypothetical protein NCL1_08169 [Trichonephila clavipes]